MNPRAGLRLVAALSLAGLLTGLGATPATAHTVKSFGAFSVALGWVREPVYVGQLNAVQVVVKDAHGDPVNDIASGDLTVQVTAGGQTSDALTLDPRFDGDTGLGTPGDYEAPLIPTVVGDYTFHLKGGIHGTAVDESATSGEKTFESVTSPTQIQFPVKVPDTSDINTKLTQVAGRAEAASASAQSASDSAGRALALAVTAAIVALVLGGGALVLARRRRP
jgi:hypothetical protein